ncbi:hypothetical protein L202_05086 [Cryptococcus amylolentus CBS 6039]|uniref:Uncharacterized protein n=1 Tax=Cryptococcus amylolentus CBS 6039 TaxID=1295533 RepID=A0A1E3HNT3_9TREE|nr:hypothetical protein L202_05086 [Cryptococcus amylolentus CBS 6039]ODN77997.1 hypothetical protein L202_05086 [Cryptococcus amylolentus CBS 6039]
MPSQSDHNSGYPYTCADDYDFTTYSGNTAQNQTNGSTTIPSIYVNPSDANPTTRATTDRNWTQAPGAGEAKPPSKRGVSRCSFTSGFTPAYLLFTVCTNPYLTRSTWESACESRVTNAENEWKDKYGQLLHDWNDLVGSYEQCEAEVEGLRNDSITVDSRHGSRDRKRWSDPDERFEQALNDLEIVAGDDDEV